MFGRPAPMTEIMAPPRPATVRIEDGAEEHGASYDGKPSDRSAHQAASRLRNKIITTGEGGMCVPTMPSGRRMRMTADHGMRLIGAIGTMSRASLPHDQLQAAIDVPNSRGWTIPRTRRGVGALYETAMAQVRA